MRSDQPSFSGSIPENYDRCLVPILFQAFAQSMATRAAELGNPRILELACGTGAVTRALAAALPEGFITATDLSEAMVNHARRSSPPFAHVDWQVADACSLPYDNESFDLVVCQFGAMFFPDKPKAMAEAYRVLAPGGQLLLSTWGELAKNPAFETTEFTLRAMFPQEETPILPTPVALPTPESLIDLASSGGFERVEAFEEFHQSSPHEPAHLADGFAYGTPLGLYLSNQGYNLDAIRLELTRAFAERMGHPMTCDLVAVVCRATKACS